MELLDIYDDAGAHVGVKDRAAVHRDGDWHRCLHLWVVDAGGVLLQRRARTKAGWPGYLDASAAGHLTAGETMQDGLREVEEELGVVYPMARLTNLGVHRVADDRGLDEGVNRELQQVYAIRDDRCLTAWTAFDREEIDALVRVSALSLARLATGRGSAEGLSFDGQRATPITVQAGELVPSPYLEIITPMLTILAA